MKTKFSLSLLVGGLCLLFSTYLAVYWAAYVANFLNVIYVWWVIIGIALLPGFMISTMFFSNILHFNVKKYYSTFMPTTIIMCAHNEEKNIEKSLNCICSQRYNSKITVFVVDNCSTDKTKELIYKTIKENSNNNYDIKYVYCSKKGKSYALNCGLKFVKTKYFISVDADTFLHKDALQKIMDNIICTKASCTAGNLLAYNPCASIITKMQIYDYLLSIAAIKRYQGSYNSTLVAQGAFSAYRTEHVIKAGGWKEVMGEDIVLTYNLLKLKYKSTYEPQALGYTTVPKSLKAFYQQRKRWAMGMLEGLREVKPWQQKSLYSKFFTFINALIVYLDFAYIFGFVAGVIFALLGYYYFVGLLSLALIPLSLSVFFSSYAFQKKLKIKFTNSIFGFIMFFLFFQLIQSIASINGYFDMLFHRMKKW